MMSTGHSDMEKTIHDRITLTSSHRISQSHINPSNLVLCGHVCVLQALTALTQLTSCAYAHGVRFCLLSAGRYTVFHHLTLARNEVCHLGSSFSFIAMTARKVFDLVREILATCPCRLFNHAVLCWQSMYFNSANCGAEEKMSSDFGAMQLGEDRMIHTYFAEDGAKYQLFVSFSVRMTPSSTGPRELIVVAWEK